MKHPDKGHGHLKVKRYFSGTGLTADLGILGHFYNGVIPCLSSRNRLGELEIVMEQANGLQYSRLPCPSLSPWVCTNSCPLSQWCHPAISSSVVPSFFCPQYFPSPGFLLFFFSMSWLLASGSPSTGTSESVLPMNVQGWFPLGLTGLICLLFKGLSRVFSSTTI